jgi:Ala-tRNA(Pro) deacylase
MEELLTLLQALNIPFTRFDHKAVFTCEESEGLDTPIPGAHTKQLLMKAKNKEIYVLAIVMHDKRVDTKTLAKDFGAQSFSFASPEKMMELLHLTPGSVTPFGLMHDHAHAIQVVFDEDAWNVGQFRFHPMTNTATLNIDQAGFESFMKHTGHTFTVRAIPQRAEIA